MSVSPSSSVPSFDKSSDDWFERLLALRAGLYDARDAAYDAAEPVRFVAATLVEPGRTLRRLLADPAGNVRAAVAARPDLDGDDLESLAYDPDPRVRVVLAGRADLPERARRRLMADMDADVLDALGEHGRADAIRVMPGPVEANVKKGLAGWLES